MYNYQLPRWPSGKKSSCQAGDAGLTPGWEKSPGGGQGNPLQYSCLENRMDRGAWWVTVHRVAKSQTGLKGLSTHAQLVTLKSNLYGKGKLNP